VLTTILSIALAGAVVLVVVAPGWWLGGRVLDRDSSPFFRLLLGVAIGMVGYLSVVNLAGRQLENSTAVASAYIASCLAVALVLHHRRPAEMSLMPVLITWRTWSPAVVGAVVLGIPQWILAVSSPYWDEVAASAIHLTAPNQFAEGVFPPRHNALPDVPIKYHYGYTILSGSVRWLTGLSANASVDVVSTGLWLFSFLFIYCWLRELRIGPAPAFWGGAAGLLGGGLAWLYLPRLEGYSGFWMDPDAAVRTHAFAADSTLASNLLSVARVPSAHLRNADASLSNLPWDIAAQFQQHAVALGIALTLPALYLFVRWQTRSERKGLLLALTVATFAVLMLGHAVFGGVAAVTAGLVLLGVWLRLPTRERFVNGVAFGLGVAVVALAHGGLLARGPVYGSASDVLTWRGGFGYPAGGGLGFVHWNVAGFGLPLLLAAVGLGAVVWRARRDNARVPRGPDDMAPAGFALVVLTVFTAFSYLVPQFAFYSSETSGVEELTEVSKFFFAARLGLALISAYGVAVLVRRVHWSALVPLGAAMAIMPLSFVYVHSTKPADDGRAWLGWYRSPYHRGSIEEQLAAAFAANKRDAREVYFDASADERRTGFLNELLLFGGSAFTLTPSAYERTGAGYRLSEAVVANRFVENSRMARLLPGAAEACGCRWYYARPDKDLAFAPMIVRARFAKLVAEGVLTRRQSGADRVLYSVDGTTASIDRDIERYWRPRIVAQANSDMDGDGRGELIFYDYVNRVVVAGRSVVKAPPAVEQEFSQLYVGRFVGDRRSDLLFGRTGDTEFRLGRTINDVVERNNWRWSYRPSQSGAWDAEYDRWLWNMDVPIIADLDGDGVDTHVMYRPGAGEWWAAPASKLGGPTADAATVPLPFAGRFLRGSRGDLGLWSKATNTFTIKSLSSTVMAQFRWGGTAGDILVPGDYTGTGYDQLAVWNPANQFWYWRNVPDGAITQFRFGTATAIPVPADYNHDGLVDPAYWEPADNRIYVTFTRGRRVDLVVPVPPHSIPAFVNWL
jgi:hypothetical protein